MKSAPKKKLSTAAAKKLLEEKKAQLAAKKEAGAKKKSEAASPAASSALSVVDPNKDAKTIQLRTSATQAASRVALIKVTDEKSLGDANAMLVQLKSVKVELEAQRKFLVQPLKDHVKNIEALFKDPLEQLEHADRTLRQKVIDFRNAEAERQAQARRRLEEEAQKKEQEALEAAKSGDEDAVEAALEESSQLAVAAAQTTGPSSQMRTSTGVGSVGVSRPWTFEVIDHAKVPREYLTVNESQIRAAVRSGIREIPGVRIFQTEQLRVGGV